MSKIAGEPILGRDLQEVASLLERFLSPLNARAMLHRALRERNLSAEQFRRADMRSINPLLRRGIGLFLNGSDRTTALRELNELCERSSPPAEPYRAAIRTERDISTVRSEARSMCEQAEASGFTVQKVTTIVSELARNIISYAKEGNLEIALLDRPRRRICIEAVDSGPGIPHLSVVLSGQYRSKTGLGRGLLGTKRLSDDFNIVTGASGTRVTVEVLL